MSSSAMIRWFFSIVMAFGLTVCAKAPPVILANKSLSPDETAAVVALANKVYKCRTRPIAQGKDKSVPHLVRVKVRFYRDGTLKGTPKVLSKVSTNFDRANAEAAIRAIRKCAPYRVSGEMLTPEGMIINL